MANKATIITDPDPIFGKLTWDSIPFYDPIILTTALVVMMVGAGVVGAILYYGKLRYLTLLVLVIYRPSITTRFSPRMA